MAALVFVAAVALPAIGVAGTTLRAGYVISLGGIVVGHASVESRFDGHGYAATVKGATRGLARMVSSATAELAGSGEIRGGEVLPRSYRSATSENGFETQVWMAMRAGRLTDLVAAPRLRAAPDRVPLAAGDTRDIVDPIGAFLVPIETPGRPVGARVCNRTIRVFDGWMRFDVKLHYKNTTAVDGSEGAYAGPIVICGARYVPVAGHRSSREVVRNMAKNERLEVWLAEVEGLPLLVPYRMVVGTRFGDLVIHATRFVSDSAQRRADAS